MRMNNIGVYDPEVKEFGEGVLYFRDDQGRDFYNSRGLFTKKFVILFDDAGVIRSFAKSSDATSLYPDGLSMADINTLPEGFEILSGTWVFNGRGVKLAKPVDLLTTKDRKVEVIRELSLNISILQDAVDLGEATEKEIEDLENLKRLRVSVSRLPDDADTKTVDWDSYTY